MKYGATATREDLAADTDVFEPDAFAIAGQDAASAPAPHAVHGRPARYELGDLRERQAFICQGLFVHSTHCVQLI
ncbi:MAG: hypothetical protein AB7Q17_17770 [Phycisphaerae bacterium]